MTASALFNFSTMLGIGILIISYTFMIYLPLFLIKRSPDLLKLKKIFLIASITSGLLLILTILNTWVNLPFPNIFEYLWNMIKLDPEIRLADNHNMYALILLRVFIVHSAMNILIMPIYGLFIISYDMHKNGADKMALMNENP